MSVNLTGEPEQCQVLELGLGESGDKARVCVPPYTVTLQAGQARRHYRLRAKYLRREVRSTVPRAWVRWVELFDFAGGVAEVGRPAVHTASHPWTIAACSSPLPPPLHRPPRSKVAYRRKWMLRELQERLERGPPTSTKAGPGKSKCSVAVADGEAVVLRFPMSPPRVDTQSPRPEPTTEAEFSSGRPKWAGG